ncbi:hypothetical protein LCGC14_2467900 [marine sediment metagenome]|uniref:Uncharacterized protein n=1 Tax=marine sediment metagenome TaxID=412755 RepID=A0A0F9E5D7_9ZZZZ
MLDIVLDELRKVENTLQQEYEIYTFIITTEVGKCKT